MNTASPQTRIDEIAPDIFRISTAIPPGAIANGFTFNQYLIRDDQPLLFHSGPRLLFDAVRGAVERVLPASSLRYISFSHFEADECGALNHWLEVAPQAEPACGQIAAMVSIGDYAIRAPRALANGETLNLGRRIELLPMDKHCDNISLGLYREKTSAGPCYLIHTYSASAGAQDRVAFLTRALRVMAGM
ncbi:MAG: hypothetical protein HC872_02860, partial [Gammaproteobacteria bacterium]|nr:hypothetical protein [Gammaproteobacteria bacterium]